MRSETKRSILKSLLFIPPIVIGVVIVMMIINSKKPPKQVEVKERARTVRVIEANPLDAVPLAVGYGTVTPGRVVKVFAEVSGKVTEISPMLEKGTFVPADTVLLKIDTTEYELAAAKLRASIESVKVQIEELEVSEENQRLTLEIEKKPLKLLEKELAGQKILLELGHISSTAYEKTLRDYLTLQSKIQALENNLRLIPSKKKLLETQRHLAEIQLDEAKLRISYATIKAPFMCRISDTSVEKTQFVQRGQLICVCDSIDVAEVSAQLPIDKLKQLLPKLNIDYSKVGKDFKACRMPELFEIKAVVLFSAGDFKVQWDAQLTRVGATFDLQTRMITAVVQVKDSYRMAKPGVRPPLVRGMYCRVELRGGALRGRIVVPRSALHAGNVYVVGKDKRLEMRQAKVEIFIGDYAVLLEGVKQGEKVVISDITPAIPGMLLKPVPDRKAAKLLEAIVTGKGDAQ